MNRKNSDLKKIHTKDNLSAGPTCGFVSRYEDWNISVGVISVWTDPFSAFVMPLFVDRPYDRPESSSPIGNYNSGNERNNNRIKKQKRI